MNELTIIMFHYVRPIQQSDFPRIKGLEFDGFVRQLDYLEDKYRIVSVNEIVSCIKQNIKIPKNSCWLTFDDGYKDHFKYVLPELKKRNLQGSFFPPVDAIKKDVVLDVNAIHHILAKCNDICKLKKDLDAIIVTMTNIDQRWQKI